jgi:hypothetical protein
MAFPAQREALDRRTTEDQPDAETGKARVLSTTTFVTGPGLQMQTESNVP